jgi:hypothetical protein
MSRGKRYRQSENCLEVEVVREGYCTFPDILMLGDLEIEFVVFNPHHRVLTLHD